MNIPKVKFHPLHPFVYGHYDGVIITFNSKPIISPNLLDELILLIHEFVHAKRGKPRTYVDNKVLNCIKDIDIINILERIIKSDYKQLLKILLNYFPNIMEEVITENLTWKILLKLGIDLDELIYFPYVLNRVHPLRDLKITLLRILGGEKNLKKYIFDISTAIMVIRRIGYSFGAYLAYKGIFFDFKTEKIDNFQELFKEFYYNWFREIKNDYKEILYLVNMVEKRSFGNISKYFNRIGDKKHEKILKLLLP